MFSHPFTLFCSSSAEDQSTREWAIMANTRNGGAPSDKLTAADPAIWALGPPRTPRLQPENHRSRSLGPAMPAANQVPRNQALVTPATTSTSLSLLNEQFIFNASPIAITAKEHILTTLTQGPHLQNVIGDDHDRNVLRLPSFSAQDEEEEERQQRPVGDERNDEAGSYGNDEDLVDAIDGVRTAQVFHTKAATGEMTASSDRSKLMRRLSDETVPHILAPQIQNSDEVSKPPGHSYQNVQVLGPARVHLGDLIIQGMCKAHDIGR